MSPSKIEQRLAALEAEVARLRQKVERTGNSGKPWWEQIAGSFAKDPVYGKAMR